MASLKDLPFQPVDEELKSVIRKSYIKPLVIWLLGNRQNYILAQESKSNWESAMTVDFFVQVIDIFRRYGEEQKLCQQLEYRCIDVCKWLIHNRKPVSPEHCSWDGVTWDTAVVLKTLLTCYIRFPTHFSPSEKASITRITSQAFKWLNTRVVEWSTEVKFPFGPADVAQILITSMYLKKYHTKLWIRMQDLLNPMQEVIIHYLLGSHQYVELHLEDGTVVKTKWWGDYFQTAEVLESLAIYYDETTLSNDTRTQELKLNIEKYIFDAINYIEHTQKDGMWGTHVDTIRTLYSYIKISNLIPKIFPQHHLVFKALRWICDDKQCFKDGSILHTMFLSIFFAPTLIQIHENWGIASKTIAEVYDDALWAAPTQTNVERIGRLEAEANISRLQNTIHNKEKQITNRGKIIWSAVVTGLLLCIFYGLLVVFADFSMNPTIDKADALKILPFIFTAWIYFMIHIWLWRK